MRSFLRLIAAMSRVERIILSVLGLFLVLSGLMLLRSFYIESTTIVPRHGGTYIEGSVGEVLPLNPWFVTGNDVSRDIVSLVFAGLMRYDPASDKIVDDLATVTTSSDNRIYTAKLKPNLVWHDSTLEAPHPVTADDILFTFKTIQESKFPNPILQQNYRGVEIEKIDDRTVRFKLSKPYAFFPSNLTLGLVPKSAFDGVPVKMLDQALDFGFKPVGAGPYSFVSLMQSDLSTEVTLRRFAREGMPDYHIDRIVFRVFPDFESLLADITNVNGVRLAVRNEKGQPMLPRHFRPIPYSLPQYVALFFNMDRGIPADKGVRLGLQLATNKQAIVDMIHETKIVDTPLLEINLGDWRYKFDEALAKGAFFESDWNVPEKVRLQRLLEQRETNAVGPLSSLPRVGYVGTGATITMTGSLAGLTLPVFVNGIRVQTGVTLPDGTIHALSGAWIAKLRAGNGQSGSLKVGMNIVRMTDAKEEIIDTSYFERIPDPKKFGLAAEEQRLLELFVASKKLPDSDPKKITVNDLYLENGYLRHKTAGDQPHTRINGKGQPLSLTLLTSKSPDTYPKIAAEIARQWKSVGIDVKLDIPDTRKEFEDKLVGRNYDVVLFGESLFDNLDSYPYWHSSQIQERDDKATMRLDAFNLSQYASFQADDLLVKIRESSDAATRARALKDLNELLKKDFPAIPLYSPLYVYAHDDSVSGITLGKLSIHADRFGDLRNWYVRTDRAFVPGKNWLSFIPWLFGMLRGH
jgi:ABC-type transport system substrate-binding protein